MTLPAGPRKVHDNTLSIRAKIFYGLKHLDEIKDASGIETKLRVTCCILESLTSSDNYEIVVIAAHIFT